MTAAWVHYGPATEVRAQRAVTLDAASESDFKTVSFSLLRSHSQLRPPPEEDLDETWIVGFVLAATLHDPLGPRTKLHTSSQASKRGRRRRPGGTASIFIASRWPPGHHDFIG